MTGDLFSDLPPPPTNGPYEERPRASVGVARCDITANKHKGDENSEAAHADTFGKKERHYEQIVGFIRGEGERGATCQEASWGTGLPYQTCSARCSELVAAGRLYRRKGDTRPTTTGSSASVLRVVEMVERNGNDAGEG